MWLIVRRTAPCFVADAGLVAARLQMPVACVAKLSFIQGDRASNATRFGLLWHAVAMAVAVGDDHRRASLLFQTSRWHAFAWRLHAVDVVRLRRVVGITPSRSYYPPPPHPSQAFCLPLLPHDQHEQPRSGPRQRFQSMVMVVTHRFMCWR